MKRLSRRNYLSSSFATAGALLFSSNIAKANQCHLTAEQTEGPFYPIEDRLDKDNDLTYVKGSNGKALGEVVFLRGVVQDENCVPVESAIVEIWQACYSGKYNHPGDPNPAPLDPNFQYWGRALTNKKGEYKFKTIRPGHYQATSNWIRPAHIHLKVHRRGFEELTTQVYFKDDPHNAKDRILQSLRPAEKKNVIVDFKEDPILNQKSGHFPITIRNL